MNWHSHTHCRAAGRATRSLLSILMVLTVAFVVPRYAAAEATPGPEAQPGPTGLPDGRVYEQVSPANKHGNEVEPAGQFFAAADGQAALYQGTGALAGKSSTGVYRPLFVSERTGQGWVTRATAPLPVEGKESREEYIQLASAITVTVPSENLSRLLFGTWGHDQFVGPPDTNDIANNIYLEGPDPFVEPEWVGRSLIEGSPGGTEIPVSRGAAFAELLIAGGSPDLKTIYFYYEGTLFPGASHLYEYKEGVLSDAGVLPSGETSSGEARPAAQPKAKIAGNGGESGEISPAAYDNEVSASGMRIFFTRKDAAGELELYARVTATDGSQSTLLVSQSQLAGHVGEPAPDGPRAFPSTVWDARRPAHPEHGGQEGPPSYVFASADGSHAFFQGADRLTEIAPEDATPKTYDFDLETGGLEYLPGVTGSIVSVAPDGSSLVFEDTATTPFTLARWVSGPSGGSVTAIATLPSVSRNTCGLVLCVGPAYTSSDGDTVVFSTESPIPGFNDGGSHYQLSETTVGERPEIGEGLWPNIDVFRYDANDNELTCVSCPPKGVTPAGDAVTSSLAFAGNSRGATGWWETDTPGRGMAADGGEVFFSTREALVPQDTNGTSDVYEWEGGKIYLISSGHNPEPSYLAGISEAGGDAFIVTAEGIAPGDRDGGYDVYDARVPRPGDNPQPEALPCEGAVCQGPPSVPNLFGVPASEPFEGAGNLVPAAPSHVGAKSLTRAQLLTRAVKQCRQRKNTRKRRRCEAQARHRYGAKAAAARQGSARERNHNGRGE